MYVPAWLTVIVWLVVPTFTVDVIGELSRYHVNTAVAVGATLDLIFNVAEPQRTVDALAVAVETVAATGAVFIVTTIALLTGLEQPPTCVATTV